MYKLLIFFFLPLFGLEIVVDTTNDYSILTMTNDKEFMCKQKDKNIYICKFQTLPSTPVFATNSVNFTLMPFFEKENFYLKIKTKYNCFLKSFKKNLYENYEKKLTKNKQAKKWVIVSYKKGIPFLNNKPINGLKFPLKIETDFYLKAIDVDSNPVDYDTQTADVIEYFTLLRLFDKKTLSLDRVENFLHIYKDSIFLPDVSYLKLKLLDKNGDYKNIVTIGNEWIKKYGFNEHLPEVLLLLAKAFSNEGQTENAVYIYERLFTEYGGTKWAYEGMVYLADQLYSAGDSKRAFELYKQAFFNTKDKIVALLSASRIAQRYLDEGNIKESVKYYEKVLAANREYLLQNISYAYDLANQLAKHEAYTTAIKILKAILEKIDKDNSLYEPILYKIAKWNYENGNFDESQKYIDKYLDKFPFGDYADNIKDLNDKVIFEIEDNNVSVMLQRYDEIIDKYKNTQLAQKALYKKITLLYKLKKYDEVLKFATKDINRSIITDSAKKVVILSLENRCNKAIKIYNEYNITIPRKYDEKLFNCAYKVRDFRLASIIPNRYILKNNKDIVLKWLKNKAKVFEATHNYKKLSLIIEDICNLEKNCYKWRYKQFFAYYKLHKPERFLKIASTILPNIKNIDIFSKVVSYAKKSDNTLLIYSYSKKIMQLEKRYKTFVQTPYIDFLFVNSAKQLGKIDEAIKGLKNLVVLDIDEDSKARAYYMLSSLTKNQKYLKKCIKLKNSKTWMPLCKDSLEMLGE